MNEPDRLVAGSGIALARHLLRSGSEERAPEAVRQNVHAAVDATLATLGFGVATVVSLKAGALPCAGASSAATSGAAGAAGAAAATGGMLSTAIGGVMVKAGLVMVLAGAGYYGARVATEEKPAASVSPRSRDAMPLDPPARNRMEVARAAGVNEADDSLEETSGTSIDSLPRDEASRGEPGNRAKARGQGAIAESLAGNSPAGNSLAGSRAATSAASPALSRGAGTSSLGAELTLIKQARGLVAARNLTGALSALESYERRFPAGVLRPEAQQLRARIMADSKSLNLP